MKFQAFVIIILTILLVITIIAFFYIASVPGNNKPFPPTIPVCPDYYYQTSDVDGNITCKALPSMEKNMINSGVSDKNCINPYFTSDYYTGTNANCLKYTWYSGCKSIPAWEGVTYGVNNPCAT